MTGRDLAWEKRAKVLGALSTVYTTSLGFFVVLSMMFVTLANQTQQQKISEAATCSLPTSISSTIEVTPTDSDNVIDCSGQDITITSSGKLIIKSYVSANSTSADDQGVLLKVNSLTIQSGGELNADGQGYTAGSTDGDSAVASTGLAAGSGGGHGGAGGSGNTPGGGENLVGATGNVIGNKYLPLTLGGAGGNSGHAGVGGAGGGAIHVQATGTVTIDGKLSANGANGAKSNDDQTAGGGGAGGSIWVEANILAGNGLVTAVGGGTDGTVSYYGGGGGGGRVALVCTTSTTFPVGNASVLGGTGSQQGQLGTLVGPGCKPAEPTVLKVYEKGGSTGSVGRQLAAGDLTTRTAFTFASNLDGSNLKLEVEVREKDQPFQNVQTNGQITSSSNKSCRGIPGELDEGSGVLGGGSPAASALANTGGGGGAGQANSTSSTGGDGGSGIVIIRYLTASAPGSVSGGTTTTSGAYTIRTFTQSGNLSVTDSGEVEYLVVAGGGGGGGGWQGGGGGGGGVRTGSTTVSAGTYAITVGAGGLGNTTGRDATSGGDSIFSDVTALGGGRGGAENTSNGGTNYSPAVGGSGGGGTHGSPSGLGGAAGTAGQGFAGGMGYTNGPYVGGGGGGAGGPGVDASSVSGGAGGVGIASNISGTTKYYGAGGGGSKRDGGAITYIPSFCGYVEVSSGFSIDTEYKWQARIVNTSEMASNWTQFGGNSTSEADFIVVNSNPSSVTIVEGNNQSETVGRQVSTTPKIKVLDSAGYGIPYYSNIGWGVLSGGGSIQNAAGTTDKWGFATADWTLGTTAGIGNNSMRATTSSSHNVTFTASAVAGSIASYTVNSPSILVLVNNNFNVTVTAKDEYGNVVPFAESLSVAPVTANDTSIPGLGTLNPQTVNFGEESGVLWLNSAWDYRKKITFDNTNANLGVTPENLDNFPVLIKLTNSNFDFSKANTNGEDIRFAETNGVTTLPYEIEKWDSSAHIAYVWVKVPRINAASDTDGIYMYYGNGAAADAQNSSLVWSSTEKVVEHFSGDTANVVDSVSNTSNMTATGTTVNASGIIGKSRVFNGNGDHITANNFDVGSVSGNVTVEYWTKPTLAKSAAIVHKDTGYSIFESSDGTYVWADGSNWNYSAFGYNDLGVIANSWQHIVVTKSGSTVTMYRNGVQKYTRGFGSGVPYVNAYLSIGCYMSGTSCGDTYAGELDEVRVSNSAFSNAWIAANYKSQTDAFNAFSTEETPTGDTSAITLSGESGVIEIPNASYSFSENIRIKVYDANGNVGYSNSVLVVNALGSCPAVTIDRNQTWSAVNAPAGVFDCRGYGTMIIESGKSLTLQSYRNGDTDYGNDFGVTILADGMTIEENARISANGTGYTSNEGPGYGGGGGTAHGGYGGNGGGTPYGNVYEPVMLGSGGYSGGPGGGAIKLEITNTLTNNGVISSTAVETSDYTGSGGSIWVNTHTIAGSGYIEANGGQSMHNRGGGGGGRIAVYYDTNSGYGLDAAHLRSIGGRNDWNSGNYGGPGTVYVEHRGIDTEHKGSLLIDNGNMNTYAAGLPEATYEFSSIHLTQYGHLEVLGQNSNLIVTDNNSIHGDDTRSRVWTNGTFTYLGGEDLTISGADYVMNGKIVGVTDVQVGNGSSGGLSVFAHTWWYNDTEQLTLRNVVVKGNGVMNLISYDNGDGDWNNDYGVTLHATNITVEAGGYLNANGRGYTSNRGSGFSTAGSAYGGYSGWNGGTPYGSLYEPTSLGTGGYDGGPGGGAFKLEVSNTLTNNGTISSTGVETSNFTGTGGSIWIDTHIIAGTGVIEANGGQSMHNRAGGGGGRIALYYDTSDGYGLNPSHIHAYGGLNDWREGSYGAPGTVYIEQKGVDTVHSGTLIVDNGGMNRYAAGVVEGTYNFKSIQVTQYGHLSFLGQNSLLTISSGAGMTGDNTRPSITLYGTLAYSGTGTLVIDGVNLGINGKADGIEDVQIGGTNAAGLTLYSHTWWYNDTNTHSFGDLLIKNNGLITLVGYENWDGDWTNDYGVNLTTNNLTIESGGALSANGQGYTSNRGAGFSTSGSAYGGYSGWGGGTPNGDLYAPVSLGTGGYDGGPGGGAIKLKVNETLTNNGSITSTGIETSNFTGTGGSIWIDTQTISGNGVIEANGGQSMHNRAGGSGGRIALYYGSSTDFGINATHIHAYGGLNDWRTGAYGGPGTVYIEQKGVDLTRQGMLLVDNGGMNTYAAGVIQGEYNLRSIVTTNYGHVEFLGQDGILNLSSGAGMVGDNSRPRVTISGTLNYTGTGTLVIDGVDLGLNGKATGLQELQIGGNNAAGLTLYAHTWWYNNTNTHTFGNVLVKSNGLVTLASYDNGDGDWNNDYGVALGATNLEIESGGTITANGLGFSSGRGAGFSGGGSGYGGFNGYGQGAPYGSVYEPVSLGSGGTNGSPGGGAIKLQISGTLTNNGRISSTGVESGYNSGTGGSIYVDTNAIAGNGVIEANGSQSLHNSAGGAGGRIAIYYETNSGYGFTGAHVHAYGGVNDWSTGAYGGPGTVYIEQKNVDGHHAGMLLVDNGGLNTQNAGVPAGDYTFKEIKLTNYGHIEFLGDSSTLTVPSNETLTGDNTSPRIRTDGTFIYTGENPFVLSGVNFTIAGKEEGIDDLVVGGDNIAGLTLYAHTWWHNNTRPYTFGNVTIKTTSLVTVTSYDNGDTDWTNDYGTTLSADNVTIEAGSTISADSQGYGPGRGPSPSGSGSSYGGYGSAGGGNPYGSLYQPSSLGSGGGYNGYGGGAFKLLVAGTFTNNGRISSIGLGNGGLAGTGGSIWIETDVLAGNGVIDANGGQSLHNRVCPSGGRIAVYYRTNNGYGIDTAHIHAFGGVNDWRTGSYGGPGTVYAENRSLHREFGGDLILDDGGMVGRAQDFPAGTYMFNDVTIGQNVSLWITSDTTAVIEPLSQVTPHGISPTSHTVVSYNFEDTPATSFADASGNGHTGAGGENIVFVPGKFGNAQKVVGGNQGITVAPIILSGDYTLDLWIKFPLAAATDGWRSYFYQSGSNYVNMLINSAGQLGVYNSGWFDSGYNVNSLSGWHHVAEVAQGSTSTFFVDGQQVGVSSAIVHNTVDVLGNAGTTQQAGTFDEVRITDGVMTQEQITAAADATEAYISTSNTLALWHLDETNNGLVDASSAANTGVAMSYIPSITGKFGNARQFNDGQWLSISPVDLTGDYTIDMWVKFPLPATNDGWRTLVSREGGTYHHIIVNGAGQLGYYNNGWVDSGYNLNSLTGWHHLASVATNSTTQFYIDGSAVGNLINGRVSSVAGAIGNFGGNNGWPRQQAGILDEVRFRNKALTAQEVMADATSDVAPVTDANTVGLWHLDEVPPTLIDGGSSASNATVNGTNAVTGKFGLARHFDGLKSYIQLPQKTYDFTTGITVSFWAKPTTNGNYARIFDFGNGCPVDNIILSRQGTTNNLYLETFQGGGSESALVADNALINNEWHHYAFTIDASGNAKMYRDGSVLTSGSMNLPSVVSRGTNYIGKSCSSGDALYAGDLDELRIDDVAESDEQIKADSTGLTLAEYAAYQQQLVGGGVIFDLTGNFNLANTASILGTGVGFQSDKGSGRGSRGIGYSGGGGGANGGNGGAGQSDGTNVPASGGIKYGDQLQPLSIGAGGGSSAVNALGGSGGGAFGIIAHGRLDENNQYINGEINIAGTINMDGTIGRTGSPGGGGGAGGSIMIHGNTCNVTGTLSAKGGEGGNSDVDGGSGGGGRVSVLYNVGPCVVSGNVIVTEGLPSDAVNYSAQVGQVGTYPPEPNSVPWPSQYRDQFELIDSGIGQINKLSDTYAAITSKNNAVLGISESVIPVGGIINGTTVSLKADAYDAGARPLSPKRLKIQVELKKVNQSFNGTSNLSESSVISFTGGQPEVLSVTITNLEMGASYKWRVRTINVDTGLASDWEEFGDNPSNQADFSITTVAAIQLTLGTLSMELPDSTSITVTARNGQDEVDSSYRGTVQFRSDSSTADLPSSYTFTESDAGSHTFPSSLKFYETGSFTVTTEDTVNPILIDTASITVTAPHVPFISISATNTELILGESTTLIWQSGYLSNLYLDHDLGNVSENGSMVVTPPLGETTYSVFGSNISGNTSIYMGAGVTITVTAPIVPTTVTPSPTATATVTPTNTPTSSPTSTPTITPTSTGMPTDTPTGTVTPTTTSTPTTTPTNTVTPTVTHTVKPTPRPTTVPVTCPVIESFVISNKIIKKGEPITISWQVSNADKVSIDAFASSLGKTGEASVVVSKSRDITLYASKGTCKRTQVKHVEVVNAYPWEGAGGMLIALFAAETVAVQIGVTQGNLWFAIFGLIDRSKKRKPWGVVYDSVTKKLISRVVVRLWDAETGKLVDTVVTDANGIFKLTPKVGKYVLKISHPEYVFPSKLINSSIDSGFTNIYTGEVIEVHNENDVLMISVPIDPEKKSSRKLRTQAIVNFLEEVVGVISPIILVSGFLYSIVVTVMYPINLNFVILGLYATTFLIKVYVYLARPKLFGQVTGVDGKAISGLELGLFDSEFKNLVSRTFTNKQGTYNFVVKNQDYYLQVMDSGYKILSKEAKKDGLFVPRSGGTSGVKLVSNDLYVYPVQRIGK